MAGTFGQQLAERNAQQQQGQGLSRTQRVIMQEQDAQKRREFEALKKQAEDLQSTEFSNISFEEYTVKYNKLSPDLQQFFQSPENIMAERNAKILVEKTNYQKRIEALQVSLQRAIERRDKYIADHQNRSSEWWSRNRDSYNRSIDDYDRDIDEYRETINYANGEAGKIDQGATADAVISYGEDKANYNRNRREARDKARNDFNQSVKTGSLNEDLKKLGLDPKNVDYNKYLTAIDKYNSNVDYLNQLNKWAGNVGYEKLPDWAREKINPNAVAWQKANPTEKLVFDKVGNVVGVQSGSYKQSMSIDTYNMKIKNDQAKYEKLSSMDTTLKLGETPKNYAVMSSGENIKPFTKEQMELNEYYASPSLLQKGLNTVKTFWQRLTGTENQIETSTAPPMEWETKTTAPQGMGGKGTAIITKTLTPESELYVNEMSEFNTNADKLSEEIFTDYEKKIEALSVENTTPENLQKIKAEEQKKFTDEISVYSGSFEKDYAEGMKKISRERVGLIDAFPLGTQARKFYYNLEDKDLAGKKEISMPKESEIATNELKDYGYYKDKGLPSWLSRELASGEAFGKGTYYGTKKAIVENPRTFAFKLGATATLVAGATAVVTYSGGAGALAGSSAVKTVSTALTGIWAGSVIVRTAYGGDDAYSRGFALGDIAGKEIIPILAGGYIGTKIAGLGIKGWENYKTMRQNPQKIAEYKRVRMEVLKAEQNFPTADTSKHLSEFQKSKFSLLTDEKGGKVKVTRKFKVVENKDLYFNGLENAKEISYNPRQIFNMKTIKIPSTKFMDVNLDKGVIKFNARMKLTSSEKMNLLKSYFGDKYSFKLIKGEFSMTKYLPKEAWNKLGLSAGSHATTSGRFANVKERYVAGAGTSELPVQYFSSEDSLYFALGKGQSSSLYGGSILGSAVPKPYVEAMRSKGFVKIPKGFKPKMNKAEVIEYLKTYAPDYPLRTILRNKGSYWKEASFMIERGRTGELVVIGRKSEIEAGKLFGTVAERQALKPYYTRVKSAEIYKDLTEIKRMGRTEYVWQVKPLSAKDFILMKTAKFKPFNIEKLKFKLNYPTVNPILKYRIWDKIAPNIRTGQLKFGKPIGSFKSMNFGEIVPIERYKPIPATLLEKEQHAQSIASIIKKMRVQGTPTMQRVSAEAFEEQVLTQKIKQVADFNMLSSSGRLPKSAMSYSEEYASMISFPKSSKSAPKPSYSTSYSSSLKSSIRSLLSSDMSSISSRSRMSSISRGSSGSYSDFSYSPYSYSSWKGASYYSPPSYPKRSITKLSWGMQGLKEKIRKKFKLTPEIEGLFPDFTARAIGLAPKKVKSVAEAMREISRMQTGFEVRTGARLKGYSPIDEKSLLRGIMK